MEHKPELLPREKSKLAEELKPAIQDYSHQDSMFGNAFGSRAYFIVHPEWLSENVNPPVSKPLNRRPWAWEQPKYRQNIQKYENGQMTPIIKSSNGINGRSSACHSLMAPPYVYTQPLPNGLNGLRLNGSIMPIVD